MTSKLVSYLANAEKAEVSDKGKELPSEEKEKLKETIVQVIEKLETLTFLIKKPIQRTIVQLAAQILKGIIKIL